MLGRVVSRSVAQSAVENYRSECKYGSVVRSSAKKCLEECCREVSQSVLYRDVREERCIIMLELLQRSVAGDLGESRVAEKCCTGVLGKSAAEKSRYVVEVMQQSLLQKRFGEVICHPRSKAASGTGSMTP